MVTVGQIMDTATDCIVKLILSSITNLWLKIHKQAYIGMDRYVEICTTRMLAAITDHRSETLGMQLYTYK